jgi:hypothetical protein
MKKFALVALLALFACTTNASAAFQVKVTVGMSTLTLTDNGLVNGFGPGNDADPSVGTITWLGSLNGYNFNITTTTTSPSAAVATVASTFLITRTNSTFNSITIEISADGFTTPGVGSVVNFNNVFSASTWERQGLTPTAESYSVLDGTQTTPNTSLSTAPQTGTTSKSTTISNPSYTVKQFAVFTGLNNNNATNITDFNGALTTNVTVVPVPPAVALLATGALPLAGFFFLRRRKQA